MAYLWLSHSMFVLWTVRQLVVVVVFFLSWYTMCKPKSSLLSICKNMQVSEQWNARPRINSRIYIQNTHFSMIQLTNCNIMLPNSAGNTHNLTYQTIRQYNHRLNEIEICVCNAGLHTESVERQFYTLHISNVCCAVLRYAVDVFYAFFFRCLHLFMDEIFIAFLFNRFSAVRSQQS